jgi:D-amino peptidase
MRVLIQADMEGVAQITSVRQVVPLWPEFWESGRSLFTDDVVAAATGLLTGGASEVVVDDQHLGGINSIMAERLPEHAYLADRTSLNRQLRDGAFDAIFQVGRHSRWGTNDGFIAHTQMPGVAFAIDGWPFTESHIVGWRAAVPLLGITGDDKLGPQLDGALIDVPFLPVKRSYGLDETQPIRKDRSRSSVAIRDFAARRAREWHLRSAATLPERFTLTVHLPPKRARSLASTHGLELVGRSVLKVDCDNWWRDAEPAIQAGTAVAGQPFFELIAPLSPTSLDRLEKIDEAALSHARHFFSAWLKHPENVWNE